MKAPLDQSLIIRPSNLPPIHSHSLSTAKIPIYRTPSVPSIHKDSSKNSSHIKSNRNHHISTPELKKKLIIFSNENQWKSNEKSKILQKKREKSLIFSLDKSQDKSLFDTFQPNISKFYLEYHKSFKPNHQKIVTKQEISQLLGIKPFSLDPEDQRLKEIIDNFPTSSFCDFSHMKLFEKPQEKSIKNDNLTSKFRRFLLKDDFSYNNIDFFSSLQEISHKTQNNMEKNPNKRLAVYEMALFLDKISHEIFEKDHKNEKNEEKDHKNEEIEEKDHKNDKKDHKNDKNNDLKVEKQLFSLQNACKICIQSLASEVSQECNERGVFLAQVWDLNVDLMNIYLEKLKKSSKNNEKIFQKTLENLKEIYKEKYDILTKNIEILQKEQEKTCISLQKSEENCGFYKEKQVLTEKARKLLEADFSELKGNYENLLIDFLKNKLIKIDDISPRKQREIFQKAVEELTKNQIKRSNLGEISTKPEQNTIKLEGIYKKMTSGELNINELKENTDKFMKEFTNLSFNILEKPKKYLDYLKVEYHEEFDGIKGLFHKEIAVGTDDFFKENSDFNGDTEGLVEKLQKEVQTVMWDEIEEQKELKDSIWNEEMIESEILYQKKMERSIRKEKEKEKGEVGMGIGMGSSMQGSFG